MLRGQGESNARVGGWFFVGAGVLTILNNAVPGAEYLDKWLMFQLGVRCILLGGVIFLLPWGRWHLRAQLVMPIVAFCLIALANNVGRSARTPSAHSSFSCSCGLGWPSPHGRRCCWPRSPRRSTSFPGWSGA